jgi:NTE family protein
MATRKNDKRPTPADVQHEHTVLLLQGGGALGAYQAGVYEGMQEHVLERAKDIQYSSKTRFNTNRVKELEELRHGLGRLLKKLPAELHDDPDYKVLAPFAEHKRQITIAHLINRRLATSINAKDYEFSRATIRQLWQAGLDDVRRTFARREWLEAREVVNGVRVFDLSDY